MIQDIAPKTFDNTYRPDKLPAADDIAMVFAGEQLLVRTLHHDEEADAPHYALLTSADLNSNCPRS